MSIDVGKRPQAISIDRGMSQRKLAARAGLTDELISQVEQNRFSPSNASLKLILDAIPIGFTDFFQAEKPEPVTFLGRASGLTEVETQQKAGKGGMAFRKIGSSTTDSLHMWHLFHEPGADTGDECDTHEVEEVGAVILGELVSACLSSTVQRP